MIKIVKKITLISEIKLNLNDLEVYKKEIKEIESEITIFHAKVSKEMINSVNVDLIGFHGHTVYHNPKEKISKQLGNAKLLNQLTKKKVLYITLERKTLNMEVKEHH